MNIKKVAGFAVDQDTEVIVNSANGWLFADSSGAGRIREASKSLTQSEQKEFDTLFKLLPENVQEFFEKKRTAHNWKYKHENLSCIKLLEYNSNTQYRIGEAVFDPLWSEKSKRKVIHAITLQYDLTGEEPVRNVGDLTQIRQALAKAIELALEFGCKSISLPIPCVRPGYSHSPEESEENVMQLLKDYDHTELEVVVCYDNEWSAKLL